jgi:hypothetical protein
MANEAKVQEQANVSATVTATVVLDRDNYTFVAANLIKEEMALFGSTKASAMVPKKMERLFNEFLRSRATQLAKQAARKQNEIEHRDEIEAAARLRLASIRNSQA